MEAIEALDRAVSELQDAIAQFHRDMIVRTKTEGRMLVAKQAIAAALKVNDKDVTADKFFEDYKKDVQPWIDNALLAETYQNTLKSIKEQIARTTNILEKNSLQQDLDDIELKLKSMALKPEPVQATEKTIIDDIAQQSKTASKVNAILRQLRDQLKVMKLMATRVDAWVGIDVTVSEEQVSGLKKAFTEARTALSGGPK
jgi:hypothetical protein